MHGLSLLLLISAASAAGGSPSASASPPLAWEKVFDGNPDRWASVIAATGRDTVFVGGAWGIASVTKAGITVESTHGHGVLGFFVESPSSVYALGEGELIWHFDGKKWTEEHIGPLPPRSQRRPFSEHMLYLVHHKDGPTGSLVAFGLALVLVKQADGTWAAPPKDEKDRLLDLGAVGPKLSHGPTNCGGRGWHWFGRERAFFTCDDHRAFIVEGGFVRPKGKFPRQCGSTVGALAHAAGDVYATCDATLWKTDGETWRRIEVPAQKLRELSSLAFADECVFIAGNRMVWRSCGP